MQRLPTKATITGPPWTMMISQYLNLRFPFLEHLLVPCGVRELAPLGLCVLQVLHHSVEITYCTKTALVPTNSRNDWQVVTMEGQEETFSGKFGVLPGGCFFSFNCIGKITSVHLQIANISTFITDIRYDMQKENTFHPIHLTLLWNNFYFIKEKNSTSW